MVKTKSNLLILAVIFLPLATGCSGPGTGALDRSLIENHLDPAVRAHGRFAVVHLPIASGTRIWNPVQILRGPDDLMYVANHTGEIYSLRDTDGDGLEDEAHLYCDVTNDGLRSPTGLAFRENELFVGAAQEIRVYTDMDGDGAADSSRTFFTGMPYSEHPYEWTSALTFGPDGHLYAMLTTDSWNAGASPDPEKWRGAMLRIAPDGSSAERYLTGIRSVHGMAFNANGDLFFADNQGGGNPEEELNLAVRGHFYGHNPAKYGDPEATQPIHAFTTEVAPAGMEFNTAENDFDGTAGDLFVAFYGPGERWNRGAVGRLRFARDDSGAYTITEHPVLTGLAKVSDVAFGPTGDLYVTQVGRTDYWYQPLDELDGAIYRVIHADWVEPEPTDTPLAADSDASADQLERGRVLFGDRACAACHAVDGKTQLIGPNLKDAGRIYSRDELIEEIAFPSRRIKPSMGATQITLQHGDVLLGRVVGSDERRVQLMLVGNRIVDVPRGDIATEEPYETSLMWEGLLEGLSDEQIDDLVSYVRSLHLQNE